MTEVDIKIIKRTQETLGKLIKKPVLTEKLLQRPPFRFLHDICTAIIRSTGLMKGLYTAEELEADNVKDKNKKLAFLQKLVDFLAVVHGRPIPVRIMSIVAGKEAEKTNEMLYLLADAVNKKVNNQECVAHVLRGNEKDNTKANNTIKKPGPENDQLKGKVNVTPNSMDPERRLYPQENNLSLEKANTSENRLSIDDDKSFYSVKNSSGLVNSEKCDTTKKNRLSQDSGSVGGNRCDFQKPEKLQKEVVVSLPSSSTIPHQPRHHRPASAKGQRVKQDGLTDVNLSANQKDIRLESTANPRLAPPRPRRSTDFVIEDSPKQMNMTNITGYIISESQQDTTDGEDNDDGVCAEFIDNEIVVNNSSADILINQRTKTEPEEGDYEHGGLVSKILQTKKEFDSVNSMNKENSKSQVNGMNEVAREREKAIFNKGINRLCNSLQTLSRSAIPLSKLMDFVQEDLETMQQEFERWRNENQMLKSQLKQEEILTQTCIEPLKAQLKELEQHAKEKERAIIKCKAKIFQNNERIQNLLFKSLEKAF